MNDSRTLDIVKLTQSEIEDVRELLEWMLLEMLLKLLVVVRRKII